MEPDQTLLNAARAMNKDALIEIFELYSTPLFNYALRLCGDPIMADHIVGDVFAKFLNKLATGHGPNSNLRSYLYETAYHQIIDEARYTRRRAPLEAVASVEGDTQSVPLRIEDQLIFKQILHALHHELTADQRHVIILRFLEEFSLRETAAVMGKTVDHVKVIQTRAIAALRKSLEKKERKVVSVPRIGELSNALGD